MGDPREILSNDHFQRGFTLIIPLQDRELNQAEPCKTNSSNQHFSETETTGIYMVQYIGANIIGGIFVKILKTTFCIYCIEVGW